MRPSLGFTALLGCFVMAASAGAGDVTILTYLSDDTLLRIGPYTAEGGKTLNLTVGIGSSAFRRPTDPPNMIWTLGDRGPNIACSDMKEMTGVELTCREVKNGRIYPAPSATPSISRVMPLYDATLR